MNKKLNTKFLLFFTITIFSEDRFFDTAAGTLYKHYISIYLFNILVFHTFWRTGIKHDKQIENGKFYDYVKKDYYGFVDKIIEK